MCSLPFWWINMITKIVYTTQILSVVSAMVYGLFCHGGVMAEVTAFNGGIRRFFYGWNQRWRNPRPPIVSSKKSARAHGLSPTGHFSTQLPSKLLGPITPDPMGLLTTLFQIPKLLKSWNIRFTGKGEGKWRDEMERWWKRKEKGRKRRKEGEVEGKLCLRGNF